MRRELIAIILLVFLSSSMGLLKCSRNSAKKDAPLNKEKPVRNNEMKNKITAAVPTPKKPKIVKDIPVLMYHEVGVAKGQWPQLYVSRMDLAGQLDWLLENGYHTIHLRDLYDHWYGHKELPEKPVILTFDDGYRSAYEIVFPLLRSRNMTATFFLFPGNFNTPNGLTNSMVESLAESNNEIGNHTYTHPELDKTPKDQWQRELSDSKMILEAIIHESVDFLCYPVGKYNETIITEAKRLGYKGALTMHSGRASAVGDIFKLKRIGVYNKDGVKGLAKKLEKQSF